MKAFAALILAVAAAGASAPAAAQFAKAEDAVEYRQGALFVMGQHFGRIGAMVNGKAPFDAKVAQENAEVVGNLAKLPWAAFGPGTEGGKAKPAVWKESAKFKEGAEKFEAEAVKLVAATKTGNLDQIKTAFGATANTCKACHDDFRSK